VLTAPGEFAAPGAYPLLINSLSYPDRQSQPPGVTFSENGPRTSRRAVDQAVREPQEDLRRPIAPLLPAKHALNHNIALWKVRLAAGNVTLAALAAHHVVCRSHRALKTEVSSHAPMVAKI
jgi:hypothetical protein